MVSYVVLAITCGKLVAWVFLRRTTTKGKRLSPQSWLTLWHNLCMRTLCFSSNFDMELSEFGLECKNPRAYGKKKVAMNPLLSSLEIRYLELGDQLIS